MVGALVWLGFAGQSLDAVMPWGGCLKQRLGRIKRIKGVFIKGLQQVHPGQLKTSKMHCGHEFFTQVWSICISGSILQLQLQAMK